MKTSYTVDYYFANFKKEKEYIPDPLLVFNLYIAIGYGF